MAASIDHIVALGRGGTHTLDNVRIAHWWCNVQGGQIRLYAIRPTANARGYTAQWQKISAQARAAQPWCSKCRATSDLVADHIVPLRSGGQSIIENVQVLCRSCNSKKTQEPIRARAAA
jgi:5-methylcytosine-specific restriction protein A